MIAISSNVVARRFPHFKTDAQVLRCVDAGDLDGTRELLAIVANLKATADADFRTNPQRSDVLREDVAYKLAVVETLQRVLDLPAQARAIRDAAERPNSER